MFVFTTKLPRRFLLPGVMPGLQAACVFFALFLPLSTTASDVPRIVTGEAIFSISSGAGQRNQSYPLELEERREMISPLGQQQPYRKEFRGSERSACTSYGRESSGSADVWSSLDAQEHQFKLVLAGEAVAKGGHFRRCASCALGTCLGIFGNDTERTTLANIQGVVRVLSNDSKSGSYYLTLSSTYEGTIPNQTVEVTLPDGEVRDLRSLRKIPIQVDAGESVSILARITLLAKDAGGCCQAVQKGKLVVEGTFLRMPDISAQTARPTASKANGAFASSVGLLVVSTLLDEPLPVCTATVIGRRTILTAARCRVLEPQSRGVLQKMWFIPGASLRQDLANAVQIIDWSPRSYSDEPRGADDAEELVAGYVERDLSLPPLSIKHDEKDLSTGVAISFFPAADRRKSTERSNDWFRTTVPISFSWSESKKAVVAKPQEGSCLRGSGSPVLSDDLRLTAVLVSRAAECDAQTPIWLFDRRAWLDAVIQ